MSFSSLTSIFDSPSGAWYNKICTLCALDNPNNRRAIAFLHTLVDKGMSLTDMTRRLNDEGFVAPKGGKFKASQVAVLLKRYRLR